jgi:bifunctional UDP-N-acetylglucosamine pyrophosphorylase/glucosamine-1-phosphate N-acetyltransferase
MLDNPAGYGRIIRKDNQIQAIVEQKDANTEQLLSHAQRLAKRSCT